MCVQIIASYLLVWLLATSPRPPTLKASVTGGHPCALDGSILNFYSTHYGKVVPLAAALCDEPQCVNTDVSS